MDQKTSRHTGLLLNDKRGNDAISFSHRICIEDHQFHRNFNNCEMIRSSCQLHSNTGTVFVYVKVAL